MPKRGYADTTLEMRQSHARHIQEPDAFGYSILKNIMGKVRLAQPRLNIVVTQMRI